MAKSSSYHRSTGIIMLLMVLAGILLWSIVYYSELAGAGGADTADPERYNLVIIDSLHDGKSPDPISNTGQGKAIDQVTKNLGQLISTEGTIVCTIPDTMRVGDFYRVVVQVKQGVEVNVEAIMDGLRKDIKGTQGESLKEDTSIDTVAITSYVEAELVDARGNFQINPLFSNALRKVDSLSFTRWEWEVSPLAARDSPLIINVSTLIKEGEADRYNEYKVFEKAVYVRANHGLAFFNFAKARWEWIFATFISPFFVWLWRTFLKKRIEGKKEE